MALQKSHHRQNRNWEENFYVRSIQSARNSTKGMRTSTSSTDWKSISPKKSGIPDKETDKQLQVHSPVNLSWTLHKNFMSIPKMIERVPGENFIGKYETHACYDLPTCIGENMYTIPKFSKMSGRERRLNGNLLRDMNNLVKGRPADAIPHDVARPMNINYEKMIRGFHKLGHVQKQMTLDIGKQPARDMNMYMQTDQYKNILYDNYKSQCEDLFLSERKANTAHGKRTGLNHRRNQSMRTSTQFKTTVVQDL